MKLPSRTTLVSDALCFLVLLWVYGGDWMDAVRARSAEVSAFLAPPPLVWPAVVLAATLGVLGVCVWGSARGRGEDFKGYRLPPILLVVALFADMVLSEGQVPLRSEEVAFLSLGHFREKAQVLTREGRVPLSPEALRPVLEEMGQPPYLVRGVRAAAWSLQVRQGCEGPVAQAPGLEVGTFIYCVASGGERAWVTLVALPAGKRFGLPEVLSSEGSPSFALVQPEAEGEQAPPSGPDTPFGDDTTRAPSAVPP
jgi:hypothetical protein